MFASEGNWKVFYSLQEDKEGILLKWSRCQKEERDVLSQIWFHMKDAAIKINTSHEVSTGVIMQVIKEGIYPICILLVTAKEEQWNETICYIQSYT